LVGSRELLLLLLGSPLKEMKAEPKTILNVKVSFELEVEYDPFKGRSVDQFMGLLEDDLIDAISELRPEIQGFYNLHTTVTNNDTGF
jgi:hypothetical protein